MKKLILTIAIIITMVGVLSIYASASPAIPTNTYNFQYYVHYTAPGPYNYEMYVYSASQATLQWQGSYYYVNTAAGGTQIYYSQNSEAYQQYLYSTSATGSGGQTSLVAVLDANYAIGDYDPQSMEITNPADENTSMSTQNDLEFEYSGYSSTSNIVAWVSYTKDSVLYHIKVQNADIEFTPDEVETDSGTAVVLDTSMPYPYGEITIEIGTEDGGYAYANFTAKDSKTITITTYAESGEDSFATITGIDAGTGGLLLRYNDAPQIRIMKKNYPNPVTLYVNDVKYATFTMETWTYMIGTDYLSCPTVIGENVFRLHDDRLNTDVDSVTCTFLKQFADDSGNYIDPNPDDGVNGGGIDSAFNDLTSEVPIKPGEGASILDWIRYIALVIAYIFEVAVAAIKDFAVNIGEMLSSLFGMITPVLSFLRMMFSSLPSPMATGLYALFVLGCVLAMFKMLRRG